MRLSSLSSTSRTVFPFLAIHGLILLARGWNRVRGPREEWRVPGRPTTTVNHTSGRDAARRPEGRSSSRNRGLLDASSKPPPTSTIRFPCPTLDHRGAPARPARLDPHAPPRRPRAPLPQGGPPRLLHPTGSRPTGVRSCSSGPVLRSGSPSGLARPCLPHP